MQTATIPAAKLSVEFLDLGGINPEADGFYVAPPMNTGADGSPIWAWRFLRDGRELVIVWNSSRPRGLRRQFARWLAAKGWNHQSDEFYRANDMATAQVAMKLGHADECASIWLALAPNYYGRREAVAAILTTDHGMYKADGFPEFSALAAAGGDVVEIMTQAVYNRD